MGGSKTTAKLEKKERGMVRYGRMEGLCELLEKDEGGNGDKDHRTT